MKQINQYLKKLDNRIKPTSIQRSLMQDQLNKVRSVLENLDYLHKPINLSQKVYLHGSWRRNTIIRKTSEDSWDIDVLAIVDECSWYSQYFLKNPQSVLTTLRNNLIKVSEIRVIPTQDYPCITIKYQSDKFNTEVIPVIYSKWHSNWNSDFAFFIPDTYNKGYWKLIYPFNFRTQVNKLDKIFNGNLKSTIRILKLWNQTDGKLMSSFLIEKLCFNFFETWGEVSENRNLALSAYIKAWLEHAYTWINHKNFWSTNFSPSIKDDNKEYLDQIYKDNNNIWQKLIQKINDALNTVQYLDLKSWKNSFPLI